MVVACGGGDKKNEEVVAGLFKFRAAAGRRCMVSHVRQLAASAALKNST